MKRVIRILFFIIGVCFSLGMIISKFDKKKGWVEGHEPYGIYERYIKRPMDCGLALFTLSVSWPLIVIIYIAVWINMGSPVIFEQERPGLAGKIIKIKKFRTMIDARDSEGNLLPDEERLTEFGRWLRTTSMDEGLELFSIIKGDLSIVGPRPLLAKYLSLYSKDQAHRHDVRPGLTGYAQAHGRNAVTWEDRFAMDIWYIDNITFINDIKIIISTVKAVLLHRGISSETSATMEEFRGNSERVDAVWKGPNEID